MEERLDKLLVDRQMVSSRTRAEEMIRKNGVRVNGKLIFKTGKKVPVDAELLLMVEEIPYVSRGALKLIHALDEFRLDVRNKIALDVGSSTGGFTQVLLERGASKVYCVDVGTNQLHPDLKSEPRIVNLEQTHVRQLNQQNIPEIIDCIVIDVSFISLEQVFPFIHAFLSTEGEIVALIKPQFEVGKVNIGKKGIVKNAALYPVVIEKIRSSAENNFLKMQSITDSPILGGDGNKEFLALFRKAMKSSP